MLKRIIVFVVILGTSYTSFAQSSIQPSGVDLDRVTWVDGDVLVRFEDNLYPLTSTIPRAMRLLMPFFKIWISRKWNNLSRML